MVFQEDTRELVVHDSVLVDANCTKEVQYLWWPVASASLFSFPPWMKPFIIRLGGVKCIIVETLLRGALGPEVSTGN